MLKHISKNKFEKHNEILKTNSQNKAQNIFVKFHGKHYMIYCDILSNIFRNRTQNIYVNNLKNIIRNVVKYNYEYLHEIFMKYFM